MARILSLVLPFILATAVAAGDSGLRPMLTGEDSKGWGGVGRLEIGGRGFCTGALIAPDLVLTAAHCLFDKQSGRPIDLGEVEFRAGWRNGRAEAYRNIRRAVMHPDYNFKATGPGRVSNDLAVLKLFRAIRSSKITPFETAGRIRKGTHIGVVSYAVGREEAPSIQEACRVMGRQKGVYVMSCDVDFGSSGAPVFAFENGQARIASVVAAKGEFNGEKVALGAGIDGPLDLLLAEINGPGTAQVPRLTQQQSRHGTGAKFVRPGGG